MGTRTPLPPSPSLRIRRLLRTRHLVQAPLIIGSRRHLRSRHGTEVVVLIRPIRLRKAAEVAGSSLSSNRCMDLPRRRAMVSRRRRRPTWMLTFRCLGGPFCLVWKCLRLIYTPTRHSTTLTAQIHRCLSLIHNCMRTRIHIRSSPQAGATPPTSFPRRPSSRARAMKTGARVGVGHGCQSHRLSRRHPHHQRRSRPPVR